MIGSNPPWRTLIAGALLVIAALAGDQFVTNQLTAESVRGVLERVIGVLLSAGPWVLIPAILAAFPNRWRLCAGFLTPVLVSTGLLHLSKWAIGRARPRLGLGAFHFAPFGGAEYCDSFPSGHAVSTGAIALLLGIYFPRARWVFYTLALLIGLERVVTNWHFLSDVLAGFVLAGLVVYGCVRLLGPGFYQRELPAPPV
jgi:membrane-associated phospholipid phosphatase